MHADATGWTLVQADHASCLLSLLPFFSYLFQVDLLCLVRMLLLFGPGEDGFFGQHIGVIEQLENLREMREEPARKRKRKSGKVRMRMRRGQGVKWIVQLEVAGQG